MLDKRELEAHREGILGRNYIRNSIVNQNITENEHQPVHFIGVGYKYCSKLENGIKIGEIEWE